MLTRWALQRVKQSAEPGLTGRKFAHLQWLPAYLMNPWSFPPCATRERHRFLQLSCAQVLHAAGRCDKAGQVWQGQPIPVGRYGVYCLRVSKVRCEDVNKL